jgi:elongation factor G
MKTYTPENIRNFAVVGHQAAGKTMLTEAMLRCAGVIQRLGSVEAGTTVSDYHASEKERQISVHASLLHCEWADKKFNIIDTPGYLDFISEGLGALRVGRFRNGRRQRSQRGRTRDRPGLGVCHRLRTSRR